MFQHCSSQLFSGGPAQPGETEKIAGGPYVVIVCSHSATVMWLLEGGPAAIHPRKITLPRLRPGKTYHYQAFPGEAGKGSFKTPPSGDAKVEFVVFGDTRTRHDVHRTVIEGILKHASPEFIMHTGDLVENGDDPSLWPIFFDIEGPLLRKAAFFPTSR